MGKLDKFIEEIKAQQANLGGDTSAATRHDPWPQMYAAMWIESLANAVKADITELSQRLNQTVSDTEHARTLQDHPSKTNDGGSDE